MPILISAEGQVNARIRCIDDCQSDSGVLPISNRNNRKPLLPSRIKLVHHVSLWRGLPTRCQPVAKPLANPVTSSDLAIGQLAIERDPTYQAVGKGQPWLHAPVFSDQ